jgi:hypothetical protein
MALVEFLFTGISKTRSFIPTKDIVIRTLFVAVLVLVLRVTSTPEFA